MDACTDCCLRCAFMGLAVAVGLGLLGVLIRSILWIVADAQPEDTPNPVFVGELALVVAAIGPGVTGEICLHGPSGPRFASARSEGDLALEKGAAVVVERYGRGIAHVRPARLPGADQHVDSNES